MGFFDDVQPEFPRLRPRMAWERPESAIPAAVATSGIVLARTDEAAVAISGLSGYPNGFDLWLVATLRSKQRPLGTTMLLSDTEESQEVRPEFLRFGIQFADGRRCTNLTVGGPRMRDTEPHDPTLQMMTTGGGRRFADWRLWVWPLPPPGPLTFVCQWPAFDIPVKRPGFRGDSVTWIRPLRG
ncbi:hypothetical protein, partial [Actinopolymorpha pittospori]